MPARDSRYSQVGVGPAGDRIYERTYGGLPTEGQSYDEMTKAELQALLKHMGLPTSGNKEELIERLQDAE